MFKRNQQSFKRILNEHGEVAVLPATCLQPQKEETFRLPEPVPGNTKHETPIADEPIDITFICPLFILALVVAIQAGGRAIMTSGTTLVTSRIPYQCIFMTVFWNFKSNL